MEGLTYKYLLSITPPHWDFRGSPYLWDGLKNRLIDKRLPEEIDVLTKELKSVFLELTEHDICEKEPFFCKNFAHGGISNGRISPEFWLTKIIPFIENSYRNLAIDIEEMDISLLKNEMNTEKKDVFVFLCKKFGYNYYALFSSVVTVCNNSNPLIIGIKKSKIKKLSLLQGIEFYSKVCGFKK